MHRSSLPKFALAMAAVLCLSAGLVHTYAGSTPASPAPAVEMTSGKVQLQSAGPLAFGPDDVLFVGDTVGAVNVESDTEDKDPARACPNRQRILPARSRWLCGPADRFPSTARSR